MKKLTSLLILLLLVSICKAGFAYNVPETVKIGLFYGNAAKDTITISTEAGIELYDGKILISTSPAFTFSVNKDGKLSANNSKETYIVSSDAFLKPVKGFISVNSTQYRGTVLLKVDSKKKITVINEVNTEEYLYSVLPKEMSTGFPYEALKAQAVCARSYAYRQIMLNGYASYGAHVDDSVSYQVYNNLTTNDKVIQAVNETAGKVLKFGDEVAAAYYFSTSCGYTTNETIWKNGLEENSYISGKLLNDSKKRLNLKDEKTFREFILNETYETYDSGETWYRWEMTVPVEHISNTICSMENIGTVKNIEVTERNDGGVVHKVLITGEDGKLEIVYEHAIRTALNGKGQTIKRIYGKDATGGNMLPSGFFVIDKVEEDGKLTAFHFRGGGFGHGAGMSQNGANHMAEDGKNYEEILALFYEGTTLSAI